MHVVEIFNSIEGEGKRTGELTTFIRLAGCNLRCSFCDTPYSHQITDGKEMTIEEIVSQVKHTNVTITGGEPLIHKDIKKLIDELMAQRVFNINIETNGSVGIERFRPQEQPFMVPQFFFTMDYKLPSSGQEPAMCLQNLNALRAGDVLKFVVGSEEDLLRMHQILVENENNLMPKVYVSPVFGDIEPKRIVEFLQENDLETVALQLQMHKIVWPPEMRGV